jgi:hypothetical protein
MLPEVEVAQVPHARGVEGFRFVLKAKDERAWRLGTAGLSEAMRPPVLTLFYPNETVRSESFKP